MCVCVSGRSEVFLYSQIVTVDKVGLKYVQIFSINYLRNCVKADQELSMIDDVRFRLPS